MTMEIERPCCYKEYSDSEETWALLGMRIKWTEPPVPGQADALMLDQLNLRLCLECKKPIPLGNVSASAWTHLFHKDNTEGIYREIHLAYDPKSRMWDEWGTTTYEFAATVHPTHLEEYRLTFNVKFGNIMMWANKFQTDDIITIHPAKEVNQWTKLASYSQITHNMYLGNNVAVMLAEEHGFDAVLNLHQETDFESDLPNSIVRVFKSTNMALGAGNPIPAEKVSDIVDWLREANAKHEKILIGDREGLGRAGSAMVAYIFANNPNLTFEEAYAFVRARRDPVYCHKGLKDTLYRLYPRD